MQKARSWFVFDLRTIGTRHAGVTNRIPRVVFHVGIDILKTVRVVLKTDTVIYDNASVSREFKDSGLTARLGVANVFDRSPPKVTTLNLGELNTVGTSAFYTQYDWLGRRFFLNVTKDF